MEDDRVLKFQGSVTVNRAAAEVWKSLLNPELVAKCVPGFEIAEKVDDNHYRAHGKIQVGFISARFDELQVTKHVIEEGSTVEYEINGEDSRKLGSISMKLVLALKPEGSTQTLVSVDSDLQITGKFASLGARIVDYKYKKMVEETVKNFHSL